MKTELLKQFCELLHCTKKDFYVVFYAEENLLTTRVCCLIRCHLTGKHVLIMTNQQDIKKKLLMFSDMRVCDTMSEAYTTMRNLLLNI